MNDRLMPMKSEEEIVARIKELRHRLNEEEDARKRHGRKTGGNRSTLGMRVVDKLQGEIAGLEWALGKEAV